MSDLQLLFLVLALLYGWECACWVRRGSVAFRTWLGGRWRAVHPGALLGNSRGGFVFVAPMPPLGNVLVGYQFPLSLSPEAALAFVATNVNPGWRPPQTGRFVRFDNLRDTTLRGRKVFVNGDLWFKAPTAAFAQAIANHLQELRRMPKDRRDAAISERVRASFDTAVIERRWKEFCLHGRRLRWTANTLFVYLFALAPIVIWHFGLKLSWVGLLAGLIALATATTVFFQRGHKALYPSAGDERFTQCLTTFLSPPAALRAHDTLSRPLLEMFHPLAIARVFCPAQSFRAFARDFLLEVRHPRLPVDAEGSGVAPATERHARALLLSETEAFLARCGIEPANLARPPAPADASCRAFCPRCHAQFTTAKGTCADCGGLAIVAFAQEAATPSVPQTRAGHCFET